MAGVTPGGISQLNISINRGHMDGIVGKTYQTYNSLPPYQEIDMSCHKLSQNDNFGSKYLSSVAATFKHRFREHVTTIFLLTPISAAGPQSSWAATWPLCMQIKVGHLFE